MGSFVHRRLDVTFTLAGDTFDVEGSPDTIKFTGLRVSCEIYNPPLDEMNRADVKIYGISQNIMNRLTRMLWAGSVAGGLANDLIKIEAGTNDKDMTSVFIGNIIWAYPDYQSAPEVALIIKAQTVDIDNKVSDTKKSIYEAETWPGINFVSDIAKKLASDMGLSFENNGVNKKVVDQYLWNTPLAKMKKLADVANIDFYVNDKVLSICNKYKARNVYVGNDIPVISPETGMIGYPVPYMSGAVFVTTLFNNKIVHGARIKIDTMVKAVNDEAANIPSAQGLFYVLNMTHRLESELPGGDWKTEILATRELNTPVS